MMWRFAILLTALGWSLPLSKAGTARLRCGNQARRALLQNNQTGTNTVFPPGNGTLVQTIEVDLLQEMCIVTFNSYYPPGEREIMSPSTNLHATIEACCISCAETARCNAWQWCPQEEGCIVEGSNTTFPQNGCQLLSIYAFSPYVEGFNPTRVQRPGVPFVAGAPVNITLPEVEGYELQPGFDLGGQFDFTCAASSVPEACMVMGAVSKAAGLCTADPLCQALVHFPLGIAFDGSGSISVLKGGPGSNKVSLEASNLNPTSATYFKNGNLVDDAGGGSSGVMVAAAVVPSVLIVMALVVISAILLVRARRKAAAAAAASKRGGENGDTQRQGPGSTGSGGDAESGTSLESQRTSDLSVVMNGEVGKTLRRQDSPPSVVDASSGGRQSRSSADAWAGLPLSGGMLSPGVFSVRLDQLVSVSELAQNQTAAVGGGSGSSGGRSMPPGSSARELLEAFSQMYAHRPVVDYSNLADMLEDEESEAAAAREEAAEKSWEGSADAAAARTAAEVAAHETLAEVGEGEEEDEEVGEGDALAAAADTAVVEATAAAQQQRQQSHSARLALENAAEWSMRVEDVEVCRRPDGSWWQLGTGAFGTVYKGMYAGETSVAIKVLHRLEEPRHTDAFAREVMLLKELRHRNIVQFLGACLDGPNNTAMLVTELMDVGDLWRALSARDGGGRRVFAWRTRGRRVMEDVARGLQYLHSKRIVHFDLKSANILLSRAGTAKLADIGMARVMQKSYLSMVSSGLGTFAWSAPEVLAGRRCSSKADIYSWGVVLWEVCTGEAPVRGAMRSLVAPDDCPQVVVDLHARCVAEDPEERPTAQQILELLTAVAND